MIYKRVVCIPHGTVTTCIINVGYDFCKTDILADGVPQTIETTEITSSVRFQKVIIPTWWVLLCSVPARSNVAKIV